MVFKSQDQIVKNIKLHDSPRVLGQCCFNLTATAHSSWKYMLNMFGMTYVAAAHEASSCCMPAAWFYPATDILQKQALKSDCAGHTACGSVLGESEGTEPKPSV